MINHIKPNFFGNIVIPEIILQSAIIYFIVFLQYIVAIKVFMTSFIVADKTPRGWLILLKRLFWLTESQ